MEPDRGEAANQARHVEADPTGVSAGKMPNGAARDGTGEVDGVHQSSAESALRAETTAEVASEARPEPTIIVNDPVGDPEKLNDDKSSHKDLASLMTPSASASAVSLEEDLAKDEKEPPENECDLNFDLRGRAGTPSPRRTDAKVSESEVVMDVTRHKMHKFSLYETAARYYLVGSDLTSKFFRVLKIDRTAAPGLLNFVEDDVIYTRLQIKDLLRTIEQGNQGAGGMKLRGNSYGLLGFIRFTEAYYMYVITGKQPVAMIGGHYIYQVDNTELIPLTTGPSAKYLANRNPEEQRYLGILHTLDLHRCFYFSNSYNVTRTLQHNAIRARERPMPAEGTLDSKDYNDMFVWNHHLLDPAIKHMKRPYDWCMPIVHGFIDQASVDVFGRNIWVTLIARRSRFFAGARFLKRGVNDLGYVANDVETEQIVAGMRTTSLHAPDQGILKNPSYTSFVQHRGSIPLYWTQDSTGVTPKPGIDLTFIDPFYSAAALHFDNMFKRYGTPVTVVNLVRNKERTPREMKLLYEYQNAISYLNQALPEGHKILYRAFDMARAARNPHQDVIASLETIAHDLVRGTGFFHNGIIQADDGASVQNGVARSNCIDCLDRTNACQFVIGKTAFALQLQALGVIAGENVNYDSDATNLLAHMYNDHGDTLASQYGGSHLVNTTDSYRKIGGWQSHSRDMLESFKRYYHNSFLDSQRQEAYNLFLGNYRYVTGQPMIWDLPNDYYLHHTSPSAYADLVRRDYINWFTPEYLEKRKIPKYEDAEAMSPIKQKEDVYESEWWREYYKPTSYTSFAKAFAYRINSNTKYLPKLSTLSPLDRSPFVVRRNPHEHDLAAKTSSKASEEVGFLDVDSKRALNPLSATAPPQINTNRITSLQQWLRGDPEAMGSHAYVLADDVDREVNPPVINTAFTPSNKNNMRQWSARQFNDMSLNPSLTEDEVAFYESYVTDTLAIPLVVSDNRLPDLTGEENHEFIDRADVIGDALPGEGAMGSYGEYYRWATEENPMLVLDGDVDKKRFQTYAKWLRGKSLFKQSKVDPEYTRGS